MFARVKKSGKYQYLQIVENRKELGKVKQRVIATVGRMDQLHDKDRVETLIRSLSRFSEKALLILSGKSDVTANSLTIGPTLIFQKLWKESGIQDSIKHVVADRKFEFDVERAIFMTVLHRLVASGSDRHCNRWRRDYLLPGTENIDLHHLYRAMAFLGEPLADSLQENDPGIRRNKDRIEEMMFQHNKDLFSGLDLVFFDTTSIYFEGRGGEYFGNRGFSKDHRPDLHQMVVGAVFDDTGQPICCEMWPGNTTDIKTLMPVVKRLRYRFGIHRFCIVADRGMISADTISKLESQNIPYILGTRMRRVNDVKTEVLTRAGRYKDVRPENADKNKPAPLKVKEVRHNGARYIVCVNDRQVRKDELDRHAIIDSLKQQLKKGSKALVGNKGYRKYLKVLKGSTEIDTAKGGLWQNFSIGSRRSSADHKSCWLMGGEKCSMVVPKNFCMELSY